MNEPLLDRTYRLLDSSDLPLRAIAEGAGVNFHWLGKFKQRIFDDPGVTRIERLYRFLSERESTDEQRLAG